MPDVEFETLPNASPEGLLKRLRKGGFQVFHFIGHGRALDKYNEGVTYLETRDGNPSPLPAGNWADIVNGVESIRLVVLNACDTAKAPESSPKGSIAAVASPLAMAGLPAVVAMQEQSSDNAAILFSKTLYKHLIDGEPIDIAVDEARLAIKQQRSTMKEWTKPILFMRDPDGRLFSRRTHEKCLILAGKYCII